MLERFAATTHHAGEGIFGDNHREAGFFLQQTVQIAQQRTAPGQGNALVRDVGTQLRWGLFQTGLDRRNDLIERIGKGFEDFVGRNCEAAWHPFGEVAPLDFQFLDLGTRESGPNFLLDEFGRGFANEHTVVATDVIDDGLVELVATDSYGALVNHAAQGNDGDFRRATADIDHHRTAGVRYGKPCANCRSHGLFNEVHLARTGTQCRLTDGAALNLRGTAGNANDDARAGCEHAARVDHANELLEHLLGHGEVGNDAVFHGADRFNIARHPAQHLLGLAPDCLNDLLAAWPAFLADG